MPAAPGSAPDDFRSSCHSVRWFLFAAPIAVENTERYHRPEP